MNKEELLKEIKKQKPISDENKKYVEIALKTERKKREE